MRAGSTGAQSVLPSELDEQTPCGFASHVKPAGQSLAVLHAVTVSRHTLVGVAGQPQSGAATSSDGAAPPSAAAGAGGAALPSAGAGSAAPPSAGGTGSEPAL